jgi:hypothetical protein
VERERFFESEPHAPHDYIVYCSDCGQSLVEGEFLCMAQEAAQFHMEETDHQVYIFREGELVVHDRDHP